MNKIKSLNHQILIYIICAFTIISCANMPLDTLNKRLAAFEITYKEVLTTVGKWMHEGRLSTEQKIKVQDMVRKISQARTAIYIAKGLNDMNKAQNQLNTANTTLNVLRELLAAKDTANK